MSTHHLYLSQIRAVFPSLSFDQVEQAGGEFHDVLIINQAWVFRFPRYREGVNRLMGEAELLAAIGPRLPLPIPNPEYRRLDPPVPGLAFMGYRRLPGEPLFRQALDGVQDGPAHDALARQLAAFLQALHVLPLAELPPPVQPPPVLRVADQRADWEKLYAEVRARLFPAMRPKARRDLTAHFEAYLDDRALQEFIPCLRHGDFGGSNILWDRARGVITGVVDFSSCAPGDPAVDLAGIWTQGHDFFERLARFYEPDESRRDALLARARFYLGTFALMEALDGLNHDDPGAYQRGMEGYI
jgi:aminoglycoside 2''-phosphotransferase